MKQKVITLKIGSIGGGEGVVESIVQGPGIIIDSADVANPIVSSESLQIIDEGNGDGYRIVGRDSNNYGSIGLGAFDFSISLLASITAGSTGDKSVAFGDTTISQNYTSFSSGKFNVGTDINTIFEIGIGSSNVARANALEIYLDGTLSAPESSIALITSRGSKALITREFADATYISSATSPSGLEAINEGNGLGWRYIGKDPDYFGNIGFNATDLSTSNTLSITLGAIGSSSFAANFETTAEQSYTSAFGYQTHAFRLGSFVSGNQSVSNGLYGAAFNLQTLVTGDYGASFGDNTIALNYASLVAGRYNIGTNINTILEIGIGTSDIARKNALEIYTDGLILAPEASTAEIDSASNKVLVTKEWVLTFGIIPTGLGILDEGNGDGRRLIGRDNLYFGSIGLEAVDLSWSDTLSGTLGATGQYSLTSGFETTSSSLNSAAFNNQTIASGIDSFAANTTTRSVGLSSATFGTSTLAQNTSQFSIGKFNVGTDINTIFEIGIGADSGNKANALEVYTTGKLLAPSLTIAIINSAADSVLLTKEWYNAQTSSDANDFLDGGIFNTVNGELTLNVSNQSDVVIDLDGRYLESFTETDPIFIASPSFGITGTQITNWDTAYGWGDHAGLYSLLGHTHLLVDVTDITATFNELNLLDLATLTVGHGLFADTSSTASWRQLLGSEIDNDLSWTSNSGDVTAGFHAENRIAIWSSTANEIDSDSSLVYTDTDRLGVGTGNPQETLHVNGNALADAFIVQGGLNTQILLGDGTLDSTLFPAVNLNTIHRTSDGSDHGFIDQDVTITSSPTFDHVLIDGITFNLLASPPDALEGHLHWNGDEGTLDLGMPNGVIQQIGQELFFFAKNQTGATIANGKPVMFDGVLGASGRILATYAIADGSRPANTTIGIATQDILNGGDGYITWFGKVRGIQTNGANYGEIWIDGDLLYISATTAGDLTNVPPEAPNLQIAVAVVILAHATNGTLTVRPTWRGKIVDMDDVNGTTPLDGYTLLWDNANQYWDASAINANIVLYDNTTSGLTATDVQAALDEINASIGGGSVTSVVGGIDIAVNNSDPNNPIVNYDGVRFTYSVNQIGIGLTVVVDDIVSLQGSTLILANATDDTKVAVGVIIEVIDDDNVVYQNVGEMDYPTAGLTIGSAYYLATSDGNATSVEPSNYVQPLWVAVAVDRVILQIDTMFVYDGGGAIPNDFLDGASFNTGDGVITMTVGTQSDVTVDIDGRYVEPGDLDRVDQTATNKGNITGIISFDMSKSNIYATLSGDVTAISFTNEPTATDYVTSIITVTQDAVTARAMDWTASGVMPAKGVVAADLEPDQTLGAITEYWLFWAGHLGYWRISKVETETTVL